MMENLNKYVFKVSVNANKLQIKSELEKRFKVEILNAYSPMYFDNNQKLSWLTSAINLIKKQEEHLDIALQFENYR